MFRHERPQQGRYRQFHQIDCEAFGFPGPDIDAEMIQVSARLWRKLGIRDVRLSVNSLGTPESRKRYRAILVEYFAARRGELDADSQRRLETNPLRILDSKNPAMQALIEGAPRLSDHLDDGVAHALRRLSRAAGRERHRGRSGPAPRARPRLLHADGLRVAHVRARIAGCRVFRRPL